MKALTLWQPWASLIVMRHKCFETRSWKMDGLIGERIAIHAGKRPPVHLDSELLGELATLALNPATLPLGAVVGAGVVTGFYRAEDIAPNLSQPEFVFGDYSCGRWAWRIEDVDALPEPVPARGKQGIWEWTPAK